MNNRAEADHPLDHRPGIIRWTIISVAFLILMAASFFLSAGTIRWPAAWAYLVLAGVTYLLDALVLIPISPDLLGSLIALLPAVGTCGVVFVRTYLEDQTLQVELPGYQDYAGEVTRKLLPGIW